ncbi:Arc-like repressor [Mycobacterium phage CRB1]|uniref:Arc-like repressor n=1 Tax=Mycobacterium phage CRB1 TaxID=1458841 RepID=UPI0003F1EBF1|nr:Arc-like repressor [Mycobacterium phage CRB1]AHJ86647.1 ParB [Mycobacterium phage CRB1]
MSESPLEQAKRIAAENRAQGVKAMPVKDAFGSSSDLMSRTNIYVPTDWLKRLKQRALDEETSVSKLIVEAGERLLKEPVRKPEPQRKWDRPDYDLA